MCDRAANQPETVEESALRHIQSESLHEAIDRLPAVQKRRLQLYYFSNLTYEQIAEKEKCSKVAVKYAIDKAIKALQHFLK